MKITFEDFLITTDKIDFDYVYNFLKTKTYWSDNLNPKNFQTSIQHSLCYSLFSGHKQIGFARVLTDYYELAYLCDIFIEEDFRDQGLGKKFLKTILENGETKKVHKWILMTKDAHEFYKAFDFSAEPNHNIMHKIITNVN